jgi:hypothetical protein
MKLTKTLPFAICPMLLAGITACSDDAEITGSDSNGATENQFVCATSVVDGTQTANILLTTSSLDEGSVSPINNGTVNDGATEWVYVNNKYLYALTYNQQNAGTTRSYIMGDNNQVVARSAEYKISRFTSYGIYNDCIITSSTGNGLSEYADAQGNLPKMLLLTYLDVASETSTTSDSKLNKDALMSENFLGNGEYVTLSGFEQVGSKIFSAAIPMGLSPYGALIDGGKYILPGNEDLIKTESGGTSSSAYVKGELQYTQYPNQCSIAIFDDASLSGKKIITTDKISYACGRYKSQYYQMIRKADNGDVYVFSPSFAKCMADARQQTTLDAGVVRIKAGASDFDSNYYVNIEKLSGGMTFQRCFSAGGNNFLLFMYSEKLKSNQQVANELALFDAENGKLTYVTGLPSKDTISDFSKTVYAANGYVYIAVMTSDNYPAIYKINTSTGVATRGTQFEVNTVTSVGKLLKF